MAIFLKNIHAALCILSLPTSYVHHSSFAFGHPSCFGPAMSIQQVLQPFLLTECLEARLHDQVANLENILDDVPALHPVVRTAIVESIRQVNI